MNAKTKLKNLDILSEEKDVEVDVAIYRMAKQAAIEDKPNPKHVRTWR